MQYLKNEQLKTIKPDWKGNPQQGGRFINPDQPDTPSILNALKWKLSVNPQREEKQKDNWRPLVLKRDDLLSGTEDKIIWLGHATFLIRLSGITFITDPVFYDIPLHKRLIGLPLPPEDLKGIDYLLLSHGHFDHCDQMSISQLYNKNKFEVLTTLRLGQLVNKWIPGAAIQEAGWYQQYKVKGGINVYLMPARHWYKRGAFDTNRALWGSFILQTNKKTIYFAADSSYDEHFKEIGELFPQIDICMLGIGAYKPAYLMKQSHTSPQEAVQAFADLKAKVLIPMHYGTYDLADEPIGEPIRVLQQMEARNQVSGQVKILGIGEEYEI